MYKNVKVDVTPTGVCWCGCGEPVPQGSFFAKGHDKAAEAMLTKLLYGPRHPVAAYLADHGYGGHGQNLKAVYAATEVAWSRGLPLQAWTKARSR